MIIWTIAIGAGILGIGSMLLLTCNVVPRIRRYSRFASAVATGDLSVRLGSPGSDELSVLGRALDEMVAFVDALQVTDSEQVAQDLLKRQVERTVPGSSAVVLTRNNSDDRLEAATALPDDSPLADSLGGATPRSCMAVLFARVPYRGSRERAADARRGLRNERPANHVQAAGRRRRGDRIGAAGAPRGTDPESGGGRR